MGGFNLAGSIGFAAGPLLFSLIADGFGLLWESRGTLYVTRDGGTSWLAEPKVARPEIDFGGGAARVHQPIRLSTEALARISDLERCFP